MGKLKKTSALKLPFWATLLTVLGVMVLCGLGTWQLQRLAWKQDIVAKLDAAYETQRAGPVQNFQAGAFVYGRVEGVFLPKKALLIGPRTWNGKAGNHLIVPVRTADGDVLVDLGWTGYPLDELPLYHLDGKRVWFEGLARAPEWSAFTPDNVPDKEQWYKPDIGEIAAVKGLANPAPYILYAEHASHKFDAQFPKNKRWEPKNDHLQYAIFWFAMAGILVGIYGLRFLKRADS